MRVVGPVVWSTRAGVRAAHGLDHGRSCGLLRKHRATRVVKDLRSLNTVRTPLSFWFLVPGV